MQQISGPEPAGDSQADAQLRRSVWTIVLVALLLPPFVGGTLMGVAGYYPLPEFYLVFTSYSALYVVTVVLVALWGARRLGNYLVELGSSTEAGQAGQRAQQLFRWLPWLLLVMVTLYSMFGALSADLSLESLGYRDYDLLEHLNNQFGLVPVVLVTVLPIYFFFTDRVGRYLAPRGIQTVMIPMGVKLSMLGIVTPVLVDSLLVGYFYNQTGHFSVQLLLLWLGLMALAIGGTWMAWRSVRQSMAPMQAFLSRQPVAGSEQNLATLVPQSLDEFGVLTGRVGQLLRQQRQLMTELELARSLSNAVVEHAGTLVVVLDSEGRMVRFNQACERLSGYSEREVRGRFPWDTVLPPEDADRVRQEAFEARLRHPEQLSGQYTNHWVNRDGKRFLLEWFNTLLLDERGRMEFMVAVGIDITERQRMEDALRQSEETYARAETIAHIGSWNWDIAGGSLRWSDEIFRIFGLTPQSFGATYEAFLQSIHPHDRQSVTDAVNASLADPKLPYAVRHRVVRPDGSIRTVQENGAIYRDAAGQPVRMIGTVQDVTDDVRRDAALRESELKYRRLHESMTDAYVQVDMAGRLVEWNPAYQAMLGHDAQELAGKTYGDLTPTQWHAMESRIVEEQILARGHSDIYEKEYLRKDGTVFPVELRTYLLRDDEGRATGMWAIVRDISERKAAEARIASLAYYDPLTGLPNRTLFSDRLQQALAKARRDNGRAALLFVDLDKFKPVNDTYGHAVGDQLLKQIARHIQSCMRASDSVSRIGGDEFVVLLPELKSVDDAIGVADKIHQVLREPMTVGDYRLEISSSIGVAIYPEHGHDEVSLMKHADDAMYRAKQAGRDRVALAI